VDFLNFGHYFLIPQAQIVPNAVKIRESKKTPTYVPTWEVFPKTFLSFVPESQIIEGAVKLKDPKAMAPL